MASLAQPGVVYTPGNAGLVQIAQQKWLALYTDGGTAWAEWRRTCVPYDIKPGADASGCSAVADGFHSGLRPHTKI